jgi:hypothetical protein
VQRLSKSFSALAFGILLLSFGPVLAGALRVEPQASPSSDEIISGFEKTRQCAADKKRLAVAFLVDESRSIRTADPGDRRVGAISRAVDRLNYSLLAVSGDNQPKVDVLVAVFGTKFEVLGKQWFSLADGRTDLDAKIGELANRDSSDITDYRTGLEGIEREFAQYVRANGATCSVLVWLTDGKIDLDNNGASDAEESKSYEKICDTEGVAPRLRGMDLFVFGLGLGGAAKEGDFDRLRRIVEGRADCGPLGEVGGNSTSGLFIPVTSADLLEEAFDNIFPPPPPPPEPCEGPNPDPLCSEFRIEVEAPTETARMLVFAPGDISEIRIIRPDGSEVTLFEESSFIESPTTDILVNPTGNAARIELNTRSQKGTWLLQVIGKSSSEAVVSLWSDAKPVVQGQPLSITREKPEGITVSVSDKDLEGISIIKEGQATSTAKGIEYVLEASAKFGPASFPASVAPTGSGSFLVTLGGNLESASASGSVYLKSRALVSGIEVQLADVTVPVTLNYGDSFPRIKPGSLAWTDIDSGDGDKKTSKISVTIVGPKDGQGGARFESTVDVVPPQLPGLGEATPTLSSDDALVGVPSGSEVLLEAVLDPSGEARGYLRATLYIELQSRDGESQRVPLDVEILLSKPFDLVNFILMVVLMIAVFILMQVAVIWPAARYVARVKGLPVSTRAVSGEIIINNIGQVSAGERTLETLMSDHRNLGSATKASIEQTIRGFTLRGFPSLVYRGLFRPKRVPVFIKRSPDSASEVTVGHHGTELVKNVRWGVVSPSLNGIWAISFHESDIRLIHSNPDRSLKGQLLYLLPEGLGADVDVSPLASKLRSEIEMKRFRSTLPDLLGTGAPSDLNSGGPSSDDSRRKSSSAPSNEPSRGTHSGDGQARTKKKDLYS